MMTLISGPTKIEAAGRIPKSIYEFIGRASTSTEKVSIAHMKSPTGWSEPGQRPEFDEYTVVLKGVLHVENEDGDTIEVSQEQAIIVPAGHWVRYSTPGLQGAEYISVCIPAFSPDTVHRDEA